VVSASKSGASAPIVNAIVHILSASCPLFQE
jgi:hypothetical protein